MRLSAYGASAALGVVLAMGMSGRAARLVGLKAEAAWDAGVFAIVCCFAASRLLLVVSDPKAFLRYPLLVLSLPSLTFAGMTLAAVLVWVHLRRKRVSVLRTLDAFAPCGALLAVFLELGHLLDGSEPGMPVFAAMGDRVTRLVPVSLYGVALSAMLCAGLWLLPDRQGFRRGQVAALGLMAGGCLAFGLDMLSLPLELASNSWLEPGQWVALGSVLAGAMLWTFAPEDKREVNGAISPGPATNDEEMR